MAPREDPVEHPLVEIAGSKYPLRYRHKDIVRLKKEHGINIGQRLSGEEIIEHLPSIIAAGLAHVPVDATHVEEYIGNLDFGEMSIYTMAFMESQKKASPEALAATAKLIAIGDQARAAQKINGIATS